MTKYTNLESMIKDGIIDKKAKSLENSTQCTQLMKPELIEYIVEDSLTYAFPVLEIFSNPRKSMQGGFIAAAFDNTFGALVYITTKKIEMASIDLSVNYLRPIFIDDTLTVKAFLKSKGKTIVHLIGEAYNNEKNLVATSSTNIILLEKDKY